MDEINTEITEEEKTDHCEIHGEYGYTERTMFGKMMAHRCPSCANERDAKLKATEDAEEKRRIVERKRIMIDSANIPLRFASKKFDEYVAETDEQRRALSISVKYAEMWPDRFDQGGGIVMCGMPGTGKTHLSAAIARNVLDQGGSVAFTSVMKLSRDVKSTYSRESARTELDVMAKYTTPDLLVIDEVGVQYGSEAEKIILFEILNGRYESVVPTIIISNLPIDRLPEYLGDRIIDRMTEGGGAVINFKWDSYRKNVRDVVKKSEDREYDPNGGMAEMRRRLQ